MNSRAVVMSQSDRLNRLFWRACICWSMYWRFAVSLISSGECPLHGGDLTHQRIRFAALFRADRATVGESDLRHVVLAKCKPGSNRCRVQTR